MRLLKAWHFLHADTRLAYKPRRLVKVGQTLRVDSERLSLCIYGLHASERILDALRYAPGPVLCRVELAGRVLHGEDKVCASERRVIAMADATPILHEFACRSAESVLYLIPDAKRAIAKRAIDTKRAWVAGTASDSELDAARGAAWDAARGAAWGDAFWAAIAADRAARADATSAARAATSAARAAYAATAARDAQNVMLTAMAFELLKVEL